MTLVSQLLNSQKPGTLQSMGLQRVRNNCMTELNWTSQMRYEHRIIWLQICIFLLLNTVSLCTLIITWVNLYQLITCCFVPSPLYIIFMFSYCPHRRQLGHKEGWVTKNWRFQIVVLEKTLETPLDSKEIKPDNPQFSLVQSLSCVQLFATPWTAARQASLPCPSPTPRACSNSRPLSWWCHPTISSSGVPFSSCLHISQHQGLSNNSVFCIRWPKY